MELNKKYNNILLYLGANAPMENLSNRIIELNPEIRFIESSIYPERYLSDINNTELEKRTIRFDDSIKLNKKKIKLTSINDNNIVDIIDSVMSDKFLPLLWTRFGTGFQNSNNSEIKRYELQYSLIKSAIYTINNEKPEIVIFSYEPHMLPLYIFKKVCEVMNIKVCTLLISPFFWRMSANFSFKENTILLENNISSANKFDRNESLYKYIEEKKDDYLIAKPFYEKKLSKPGIFGIKNITQSIRANNYNPKRIISSLNSKKALKNLITSREKLENKKYVSFFLHMQPEQTTLPDGGVFTNQIIAIQALYSAIKPLGISLIVREHPSTFKSTFTPKWRPNDFYTSIMDIGDEIFFDDLDQDPYTLIKNSIAVSSITGTCILESMLNGIPAIAFGKHSLIGYESNSFIDTFSSEQDLQQKLLLALKVPKKEIISSIEDFLYEFLPKTFGFEENIDNSEMSLDKLREFRCEALIQVLDKLTQ